MIPQISKFEIISSLSLSLDSLCNKSKTPISSLISQPTDPFLQNTPFIFYPQ